MTQTFEVQRPAAVNGSFLASVPLLVEQMRARGYAPASLRSSTGLVQDFATWLDQREICGRSVEAKLVDEYLDERWLHRRRRRGDAFTLREFVRLVSVDSTAATTPPIATTPRLHVRRKFEHYLLCERGLALASIRLYGDAVGRFLEHAFGDGEVRLGRDHRRGRHSFRTARCGAFAAFEAGQGHDLRSAFVSAVRPLSW